MRIRGRLRWAAISLAIIQGLTPAVLGQPTAQSKKGKAGRAAAKADRAVATFPPSLPGGQTAVTDTSDEFLKPPATLKAGVAIAKTPPTIDFLYFPGQTYAGKPWSNWGDGVAVRGKYYTAIGDHLAPAGNAFVFEYDAAKKALRRLTDVRSVLNLPDGHYTPGKIHSRIDLGSDGWLYYSTHRGSTQVTTDKYHYQGDWVFRCDPTTGHAQVVVQGPVPKHCIPASVLDPDRMIFYGGTAAGTGGEDEGVQFFAYDVKNQKLLYSGPDGPARYLAFARSTGRVYYTAGKERDGAGVLMRYDPAAGAPPVRIPGAVGIRAATQETPQGVIYTVSLGQGGREAHVYALDTKTEAVKDLGAAAALSQSYVASLDADPTGRYLYYVPGAHGASDRDGSAVIQFDVTTGAKKVVAFLDPFYRQKYGCAPVGTYSTAVDPAGDKLYVTWNVNRGGRAWDCCALTAIHIPASERLPGT
jgi:hypothetical protein